MDEAGRPTPVAAGTGESTMGVAVAAVAAL